MRKEKPNTCPTPCWPCLQSPRGPSASLNSGGFCAQPASLAMSFPRRRDGAARTWQRQWHRRSHRPKCCVSCPTRRNHRTPSRQSLADDVEFGIRHSLMREAAYSLLTDEDRTLGTSTLRRIFAAQWRTRSRRAGAISSWAATVPCAFHYVEAAIDKLERGGAGHEPRSCAWRRGASGPQRNGLVRCAVWMARWRCLPGDCPIPRKRPAKGILLSPPGSHFYYWSILGLWRRQRWLERWKHDGSSA